MIMKRFTEVENVKLKKLKQKTRGQLLWKNRRRYEVVSYIIYTGLNCMQKSVFRENPLR